MGYLIFIFLISIIIAIPFIGTLKENYKLESELSKERLLNFELNSRIKTISELNKDSLLSYQREILQLKAKIKDLEETINCYKNTI